MLTYVNSGIVNYATNPVQIYGRLAWEFQSCLSGSMAANLRPLGPEQLCQRSLWAFPKEFPHGWISNDESERVVFHHTIVPAELERLIPSRGYYRIDLSESDCERIRQLANHMIQAISHPTELVSLQTRALADELSLMALRDATPQPLSSRSIAHDKTERALSWYRENLAESPSFECIAASVYVSPSHLRRLFHEARGESPQKAFNRARMETVKILLNEQDHSVEEIAERVGLSSASALSRAVKAHFGVSPNKLRQR